MIQKPFLIDGIVGNSRMLVTLTTDGEIQRLFWPHVDGPQHVARILGGVAVQGGPVRWSDDPLWEHSQAYEPDQNILVTTSQLPALGLAVESRDAALPDQDVLVRRLTFTNAGPAPLSLAYALYQWVQVDENPLYNTALLDEPSDSLVHYRRTTYLGVGADRPLTTFATGAPEPLLAAATRLAFDGRPILHGDVAAAGLWELGTLNPGDTAQLTLFWALGRDLQAVRTALEAARHSGGEELLAAVRRYWSDWLARARPLQIPPAHDPNPPAPAASDPLAELPPLPGLPAEPAPPEAIQALYRRSLLVFKLMSDAATGAVIAAPEFDPAFSQCGGYGYCWGRDAGYITVAMDQAGYHDLAGAFYHWAVQVQEPEGWWMHRHQTTGEWGPSWGLIQIDETGSILYGMALHARLHGGEPFAREVWPAVERAAEWLMANRDPETGLPAAAVDLWEERMAQLTYSAGAVYAGLQGAAELAETVGEAGAAARYRQAAAEIQAAIRRESIRDGRLLRSRYLQVSEAAYQAARAAGELVRVRRGPKSHLVYEQIHDPVPDVSLLGLSYPFPVLAPDDPVMAETAHWLLRELWVPGAGGLRRYRGDVYRAGNPWVLTTLWWGLYAAQRGHRSLARRMLDWAVARQNSAGLLPEQVDPQTGRPSWVLPLTWSHAMFVLLAIELYGGLSPVSAVASVATATGARSEA